MRAHRGTTHYGEVVEHNQWMIFLRGRLVGFVGKGEGKLPAMIRNVSESDLAGIRTKLGLPVDAHCPTALPVGEHSE